MAVVLVSGAPSGSNRVFLLPDDINKATLRAASLVAVAISSHGVIAETVSHEVSAYAPPPLQMLDVDSLQPDNLEGVVTRICPDVFVVDRKLDSHVGRHYIVAEVWPGVKLQKGMRQMTVGLRENFGRPTDGCNFLVYAVTPLLLSGNPVAGAVKDKTDNRMECSQ